MLIVALVLAVIGLAALVTAVVTSNEVVAWVCIGASALGVLLLVIDAFRERQQRRILRVPAVVDATEETLVIDTEPETEAEMKSEIADEDHPEEVVHDEPEYDTYEDDEPEYPQSAEESAMHIVDETEVDADPEAGETAER